MIKYLKRQWAYWTAKLTGRFDERADPKVQLEQAMQEAQEQHRRLREQAANVIANQKQTELRLNRSLEELGPRQRQRSTGAASWRPTPTRRATPPRPAEYNAAAEAFANRLIALERDVDDLKALSLQSAQAADQAKAAVQQNATALQRKLSERQKLMSQLDQAKMQEQMNKAMASLSATVGDDVPTFDEVRDKIEARYAKAKGMSELTETSVESRMLEIEQATQNSEAQGSPRRDAGAARPRCGRTSLLRSKPRRPLPPQRRRRSRLLSDAAQPGSTTRSSRWTTSCGHPSGSSEVRRPMTCERSCGVDARRGPSRRPRHPGPATSIASSARKSPFTPTTPAGSSDRLPSTSARRAPSSTSIDARGRQRRTRSTACGPAGGVRAGARPCRRPRRRRRASSSTPGRSAAAMTARTPDHDAMRAAATFDAMPPLPRCEPAPPICSSKARSMPTTSSMSDAFASRRGSAVSTPACR